MKTYCIRCGASRQLVEFAPDRNQCKLCRLAIVKAYDNRMKLSNEKRSKKWRSNIARRYNISEEQYRELSAQQNHLCGICGKDNDGKRLAVDHCHETGTVRGLLCKSCNMGLGQLGDSTQAIKNALNYLSKGIEAV